MTHEEFHDLIAAARYDLNADPGGPLSRRDAAIDAVFTRLGAAEKALEAADAIRSVVPWVIAESERGLFNAYDAARAAHRKTTVGP
jgi:hypothetical protein